MPAGNSIQIVSKYYIFDGDFFEGLIWPAYV